MVGSTVRRTDEDLDVGTQPPSLGGQSLDLLARAGARREQHDTLAGDRKVPTHSGGPIIAEERNARPAHNTVTATTAATTGGHEDWPR